MPVNSQVHKMKSYVFYFLLFVSALFIYVTEGIFFNPFALWGMLPLLISFAMFRYAQKKETSVARAYSFLLAGMVPTTYFHLTWFLNVDDVQTGSSTASLIFLFIPIYAMIAGGIGYFLAWTATE
jgi:hypothetical protein